MGNFLESPLACALKAKGILTIFIGPGPRLDLIKNKRQNVRKIRNFSIKFFVILSSINYALLIYINLLLKIGCD